MAKKKKEQEADRTVATNRKARHQYHLTDKIEAGIVLHGSEVKSIRAGLASIAEAYCRITDGEVWIVGLHIPEYLEASYNNHEPTRRRKLLLARREIKKLERQIKLKGTTLVPLDIHFNERGIAKVTIALATGKKQHDKRADMKKRDMEREAKSFRR